MRVRQCDRRICAALGIELDICREEGTEPQYEAFELPASPCAYGLDLMVIIKSL